MRRVRGDAIVVGGGMAGWVAARRAQQLGLRVVLLDKGDEIPGWCNARMSNGHLHAAYLNIKNDPGYLERYCLDVTDGHAVPRLARAWAKNCSRAIDWLDHEGVAFAERDEVGERCYLSPVRRPPAGLAKFDRDRGPDRALTLLASSFVRGGGVFSGSTRALQLVLDLDGTICGVIARAEDALVFFEGRCMVIADGGFQANPEMLVRYIGPRADEMLLRAMPTGTGDGIRMALEIGAKAVHMNYFYGHMVSLDALTEPALWPYPLLDGLISEGVLVNRRGERFVDEVGSGVGDSKEAISGIGVTNAVGRSEDPRDAIVIVDHATWESSEAGYMGTLPVNPSLVELGGTVHSAESLEALASKSRIRTEGLLETLKTFNAAAAGGQTSTLYVPRSGSPRPLNTPPYYAIPCMAAITFTLGGLLVSADSQVLDSDDRPIPGLYAAGASMGGLQGGPSGGYVGGLSEALVFGLLAAEHAGQSCSSKSDQ